MADNAQLIHDVDCEYDSGKFILTNLPEPMPEVFTVRFTTPETFTQGDTIVAAGRELVLRTPANINASSAFFRANTVFHCDIDLTKNRAFTWSNINTVTSSGEGTRPNLSNEEQYAGYRDLEGRKVYQKTFYRNGNVITMPHEIENIKHIIEIKAVHGIERLSWGINRNAMVTQREVSFGESSSVGYITLHYTCTDR